MYVCMYIVCMYVCTYVCMYVCMCVHYMYVCTHVHVIDIKWKEGRWSKQEIDILKQNVIQFMKVINIFIFIPSLIPILLGVWDSGYENMAV